ncbi:hypothetical protein B5F97_11140, partial [Bacteroides clarus]
MISNKKNEIKVTHFPKKHRFSPILFCKDNDKITRKEEIKAIPGEPPYENPPREVPSMGIHSGNPVPKGTKTIKPPYPSIDTGASLKKRRLPTLPLLRSTIGVT